MRKIGTVRAVGGLPHQKADKRLAARNGRVRPSGVRGAFTIVEIILAMAVVSAVSVFAVWGVFSVSEGLESRPPDSVFISAVKTARAKALEIARPVFLRYDPLGYFEISDVETAQVYARVFLKKAYEKTFLQEDGAAALEAFGNKVGVAFLPVNPEILGKANLDFGNEVLSGLEFWPDSTMTAAIVVISRPADVEMFFETDPFSCAVMEVDAAKDPGGAR